MRRPAGIGWSGGARRTRVKICCISSTEEAGTALGARADLLGLVSAMPSGPGPIDETRIAEIVRWVEGRARTVLLTSRQDAGAIAAQIDRIRPDVVQLVDAVPPAAYEQLRAAWPAVVLMQVIHVQGMASVDEAMRVAPHVDVILLDSGNPAAAVKELGGTGRVHDWTVSRVLREAVDVPVVLAGGLTPENVGAAISMVAPFGVDVCSGVRTRGALDPARVHAFVAAVHAAG